MFYRDGNNEIKEANETDVYRVYGCDSGAEGGFITDKCPENPISAREDLALSWRDFTDDEGDIVRNTASKVATGTIYTDDSDRIINISTGEVTDEVLEFTTVEPTSDRAGGGNEYKPVDDFTDVVEVSSVDDLRHTSTDGWNAYIEAENAVMEGVDESDNGISEGYDSNNDEIVETSQDDEEGGLKDENVSDYNSEALETLQDEAEYELQSDDVETACWGDDAYDSDYNSEALETLQDEAEHELQSDDVETACWGDDAYDSDYNSEALDALLDDVEHELQSDNVETACWGDDAYDSDYNSEALDALLDDVEHEIQSDDVETAFWGEDAYDSNDNPREENQLGY